MSRPATQHLISLNIASVLREAAREGPCRVFMADVKLLTPDRRVYDPDVMVVCGPGHDAELLEPAPCLVVEVTSPGGAGTDGHEKLAAYQTVPALVSYLVVDQDRRRVEHHRRWPGGAWQHTEFVGEGQLSLSCPPATLTLDAIYEGIEMPADGAPIEGDGP